MALQIFPDFAQAHFAVATLGETAGDTLLAEHHYREAVRAQPEFPAAPVRWG